MKKLLFAMRNIHSEIYTNHKMAFLRELGLGLNDSRELCTLAIFKALIWDEMSEKPIFFNRCLKEYESSPILYFKAKWANFIFLKKKN
jgi:hypothetical protein